MKQPRRSVFGILDKNKKVVVSRITKEDNAYEMLCLFTYKHDAQTYNEEHFDGGYVVKEMCGIRLKKYAKI